MLLVRTFCAFAYLVCGVALAEVAEQDPQSPPERKILQLSLEEAEVLLSDSLSATDKSAIEKIKSQMSAWPKDVIDELRNYRQFVIDAQREAIRRYAKLSPVAKEAIRLEERMRQSLSPQALQLLDSIRIK